MPLPFELLQQAAVPAAESLVAGLWQGIALTLVAGVVLRVLPGTTASARFAVWTAVFCASAGMPLTHLLATKEALPLASSPLVFDPRWSYFLAGLWLGLSVLGLLKLVLEAASLRKLWREAEPLAYEVLEAAGLNQPQPIAHQVSLARRVQVCSSSDVDRPSVIGFFAPKILIPEWLCSQLSATELRHVVLHEAEHLRRRDDWLNLLQKIGLVLFPLNPAMFWIDRRLSTEREIACDDGVLAQTRTPRAYAASLTSIAERRINFGSRSRIVALALGAFGTGKVFARRSEFCQRIERILKSGGERRATSRPAVAAVLIAAIFGGSAAITHVPEFISFRAVAGQREVASTAQERPSSTLEGQLARSKPHLEDASFRLPTEPRSRATAPSARPAVAVQTAQSNPVSAIAVKATADTPAQVHAKRRNVQASQAKPQWLLLTSWERTPARSAREINANATEDNGQDGDVVVPVSRVVLRTPDGRFLATPYAAVPTQAGWLIVQL